MINLNNNIKCISTFDKNGNIIYNKQKKKLGKEYYTILCILNNMIFCSKIIFPKIFAPNDDIMLEKLKILYTAMKNKNIMIYRLYKYKKWTHCQTITDYLSIVFQNTNIGYNRAIIYFTIIIENKNKIIYNQFFKKNWYKNYLIKHNIKKIKIILNFIIIWEIYIHYIRYNIDIYNTKHINILKYFIYYNIWLIIKKKIKFNYTQSYSYKKLKINNKKLQLDQFTQIFQQNLDYIQYLIKHPKYKNSIKLIITKFDKRKIKPINYNIIKIINKIPKPYNKKLILQKFKLFKKNFN